MRPTLLLLLPCLALAQTNVVKYHATIRDVKYVYGPATPVAHVKPGAIIDTNTLGAFAPGFGALNETGYTPMLHPPLPEKIWFYPIDKRNNTATFQALDSKFSV